MNIKEGIRGNQMRCSDIADQINTVEVATMSCRKIANSELSKDCFNSTIPVQWLCVMLCFWSAARGSLGWSILGCHL